MSRDIGPLLELGATVLAEYLPERVTLADVEGNEFCAFIDASCGTVPPALAFAVCTDSDRPEELAAWWAAPNRRGCPGRARWHAALALRRRQAGTSLIWKFVRVADDRVVPNRWQWTVIGDTAGVDVDPQGNEFGVSPPTTQRAEQCRAQLARIDEPEQSASWASRRSRSSWSARTARWALPTPPGCRPGSRTWATP